LPDPEGRAELVRSVLVANRDALYSTACRLAGRAAAEDLVQETARKALDGAAALRHERNLRAWLFRILLNSVRDHLRRAWSWEALDAEDDVFGAAADSGLLAFVAAEDVRRALERLQPARRALVLLVDVEEFTIAEAGAMLGIPAGTVASRLARAHAELRELLEEYGPGTLRRGGCR